MCEYYNYFTQLCNTYFLNFTHLYPVIILVQLNKKNGNINDKR